MTDNRSEIRSLRTEAKALARKAASLQSEAAKMRRRANKLERADKRATEKEWCAEEPVPDHVVLATSFDEEPDL